MLGSVGEVDLGCVDMIVILTVVCLGKRRFMLEVVG